MSAVYSRVADFGKTQLAVDLNVKSSITISVLTKNPGQSHLYILNFLEVVFLWSQLTAYEKDILCLI
jgi:hypothetical protein